MLGFGFIFSNARPAPPSLAATRGISYTGVYFQQRIDDSSQYSCNYIVWSARLAVLVAFLLCSHISKSPRVCPP
jgi:hypothetical protein